MNLRRSTDTKKLEAELRALETKRTELAAQIERAEADAAAAQARLESEVEPFEASAYLGEIDADEARGKRDEVETVLRGARAAVARLGGIDRELARRVEKKRAELEQARLADAERELELACADAAKAAGVFKTRLQAAEEQARELERKRERVRSARAAVNHARGERHGPWPDGADEPDWDAGLVALRSLLEQGPFRPNEQAEQTRERQRREEEQRRETLIRQAVQGYITMPGTTGDMRELRDSYLLSLPDEEARQEARRRIEAAMRERAGRRVVSAGAQHVNR